MCAYACKASAPSSDTSLVHYVHTAASELEEHIHSHAGAHRSICVVWVWMGKNGTMITVRFLAKIPPVKITAHGVF